jgi:hypothetical protein
MIPSEDNLNSLLPSLRYSPPKLLPLIVESLRYNPSDQIPFPPRYPFLLLPAI